MRSWSSGIAFALCLVASAASAQTVDLSFEEAIERGRTESPAVVLEASTLGVTEAEIAGAQVHPNLEFTYQGLFTVDGSRQSLNDQQLFALSQPILVGDQIGVRSAAAYARVDAASGRIEEVRALVARDVADAYVELALAEARVTELDAALVRLDSVLEIVRGRAILGDRSRYDSSRVELERGRLATDLAAAQADVVEASGRLARLLGRSGSMPHATTSLDALAAMVSSRRDGVESHPSVRRRRLDVTAAERTLTSEEREVVPTPTFALGYSIAFDAYASAIFAGISVPLQTTDRNQGGIARAEAEREVATAALDVTVSAVSLRIEAASATLAAREAALARFASDVVPIAEPIDEMAIEAYRTGAGTLLELIDVARSAHEIAQQRLELLEGVASAKVELRAAEGTLE